MKVLHIVVGLGSGGAERMMQRLVQRGPSPTGVVHSVVSLTGLGEIGPQLLAAGVSVQAMRMRTPIGLPVLFLRLIWLIRRQRPDVVQTWMYHADFLGGLAARLASKCPVIWGVRTTNVPVVGAPATALLRWICARLSYWVPDCIVCAAHASCRSHVTIGYDPRKMVVIPNGYDLSSLVASCVERGACRAGLGVADDELVIGSMGRLHVDKDHENFVRTASLLASRHPRLRFLLVGRGLDSESALLQRWLADSGVPARFILAGERTDVAQCLAAMDVFCLHSRNEGFPNVLAEAMAMGRACVTTDVGDAAMLIADTGIVVPREDPAQLAQAVERLLSLSTHDRKALGARARVRIKSQYDIAVIRGRFEALYHQLVDEGRH